MHRAQLRLYGDLVRTFRNAPTLIRAMRGGPPAGSAVLWDGTRLCHPPGASGLAEALSEVWFDRCYDRDRFYEPADGDAIVDCGAHVGTFSIWMARRNPACRVVAIEPSEANHACLVENIRANRIPNVRAHRLAISGTRGRATIEAVGRTLDRRLGVVDAAGGPESTEVVVLEDLFGLAEADAIAFLKVDIEGSEVDLFGAARPDDLRRIGRIGLEYHDNIREGARDLVTRRLAETHEVRAYPSADPRCGILLAKRR